MPKVALKSLLLATLLATTCQLHAQPSTALGDPGCGEWFVLPNATKKLWLLGFLSGMNVAADRQGAKPRDSLAMLPSASQAFLWVDNHCRANPKSTVETAAVALFDDLGRKNKR